MGVGQRCSAAALLTVGTTALAAGAQAQKMPPGAYLRQPVASGSEISKQVSSDPLVAERYSRIFHLSPDTISKAVSGLKLTTLKDDRVMRVYYVHSGEKLGYKLRRVPAGTQVFVASDGTPAFVKACGNPLRPELSTGMTASLTAPAVRKFRVNEPVVASASAIDAGQMSAPVTDEEGRVVSEGPLNVAESTEAPEVFMEETEAADHSVTVKAPSGSEQDALLDWYHGHGTRLASVFNPPSAPEPPTGGGPTPGQPYAGPSTYHGPGGLPGGPNGPFIPGPGNSPGAASTPEPGSVALGSAMFLAGGLWIRRRQRK